MNMELMLLHLHKSKLEAVSSVNTPATIETVTVAFDLYGKNTDLVNVSAAITL